MENGVKKHMKSDSLAKNRRSVAVAYVFMFLALLTIVSGIFAYWFARKVLKADTAEVWLQAQALWIMRNVVIYVIMACFAALWFIPLHFVTWDSSIWATATTVVGVIFAVIAFLFLLNTFVKGVIKFVQNKAVY